MPKLYISAALLAAAALLQPVSASADAMPGVWKLHPSFDIFSDFGTYVNHVEKLMDGPRYLFIWSNSAPYYKSVEQYSTPCATLWFVDKSEMADTDGEFSVKHISELAPTNAMGIQYADYNVNGGYVAVIYPDNSAEIIYEDGHVVKCADLQDCITTVGASSKVSHLTFDDERGLIYGVCGRTVFALDPVTGKVEGKMTADRELQSFIRVGDNWMACDEVTIYTAEAGDRIPVNFDSFEILPIIGDALPGAIKGNGDYAPWDRYTENQFPMPWRLLPVNDKIFMVTMKNLIPSNKTGITTSTAQTNYYTFSIALLDDGRWKPHYHHSLSIPSTDLTLHPNHPSDQMLHITDKGYTVSAQNRTYKYNFRDAIYNHKTGAWSRTPHSELQYIPQANPGSGYVRNDDYDWQRRSCSFDEKRYWFYQPMRGIYYRDYDASATGVLANKWSEYKGASVPNAPAVFYADDFFSHPDYGMMIRNLNRSLENASTAFLGDQLSAWKDGKWTMLGVGARNPVLGGLKISATQAGRVDIPSGIAVDPMNSDMVYCGGYRNGITRINLGDADDILTLTKTSTNLTSLPGVAIAFNSTKSSAYCSAPAFDNNGVMWTSYFNYAVPSSEYNTHAYIYYWLPEDRMAVKGAEDYAAHPMREIVIDKSSSMHLCELVPLTYAGNDTKLVYLSNNQDVARNMVQLYDHKGTLDDTSDDKLYTLNVIRDDAGGQIEISYNFTPVEDPVDGRVWIPCVRGLLWLNPADITSDRDYLNQLNLSGDEAASREGVTSFYNMEVRHISFDPLGRKWISTANNGLFVLSADARHLVAHLTTVNSGLPSDDIYGSGWDYATNSMFISTGKGIMQFTPAEMMDAPMAETVHAFPTRILPGYKGHVDITGVPAAASLIICDDTGNEVDSLPSPVGGRVQWHPASSTLSEGVYWIADKQGNRLEKITVMK